MNMQDAIDHLAEEGRTAARCFQTGCTWSRRLTKRPLEGQPVPWYPWDAAIWFHGIDHPEHPVGACEVVREDTPLFTEEEFRLGDTFRRGWYRGAESFKQRIEKALAPVMKP